ncbi:hypothetical protein SGRA_3260 [Saprospira grandis str. Lewin]|uniref:Uncharacterized protein n=1 Tax=Saprospira grandis (strain Lewin) TaxID=984262 RepID=H6KZY1_SAPGL|nr:hypothetical protein SGRA_3260 [Saprospira grandis str. Lewin]
MRNFFLFFWGCPCGLRPWVATLRSSLLARPFLAFGSLVWPSATAAHRSSVASRPLGGQKQALRACPSLAPKPFWTKQRAWRHGPATFSLA